MPDPAAAQTLSETFKAFMSLPPTTTFYTVAKDFQTIAAGAFAVYAASRAYKGVMKRIAFDREVAEERMAFDRTVFESDRKATQRDQQSQKYGAFLRLQSQMRSLASDASVILQNLQTPMRIAEGKSDYIEWPNDLGFGEYDELKKAWRKIDLFPLGAIFFVDIIRRGLQSAKQNEGRCVAERDEKGQVPFVYADIYRNDCILIESRSKHLIEALEGPIRDLTKLARVPID